MPLSKRKVTSADELSSADERSVAPAPAKKARTLKPTKGIAGGEGSAAAQKDSDGNVYWELTGRRRVTISEYNGRRMVGIREYYEKDGKELPGKKGISLPLDQFSALISLLPQIEGQLKGKGDSVPRPDYDGSGVKAGIEDDDGDEDSEDGGRDVSVAKKGRGNHEETSDED